PRSLEVTLRGHGKAGLDHVHAQPVELTGHAQLFFQIHAAARGLLAVAERGVEDGDGFAGHSGPSVACANGEQSRHWREAPTRCSREKSGGAHGITQAYISTRRIRKSYSIISKDRRRSRRGGYGSLRTGDVSRRGRGGKLLARRPAVAPHAAGGQPGDPQAGKRSGRIVVRPLLAARPTDGRGRAPARIRREAAESARRSSRGALGIAQRGAREAGHRRERIHFAVPFAPAP